jgi:hypothetical protein
VSLSAVVHTAIVSTVSSFLDLREISAEYRQAQAGSKPARSRSDSPSPIIANILSAFFRASFAAAISFSKIEIRERSKHVCHFSILSSARSARASTDLTKASMLGVLVDFSGWSVVVFDIKLSNETRILGNGGQPIAFVRPSLQSTLIRDIQSRHSSRTGLCTYIGVATSTSG